ncbi:hypothetical protein JS562_29280, partial [Agrobacterium sp. S2]|nr:hypothetical protein [Agrobacterium sp. S2]
MPENLPPTAKYNMHFMTKMPMVHGSMISIDFGGWGIPPGKPHPAWFQEAGSLGRGFFRRQQQLVDTAAVKV